MNALLQTAIRRATPCVGVAVLSATLAACSTVGPNYTAPTTPAPTLQTAGNSKVSSAPLPAQWWKLYNNPKLNAWINEALQANRQLQVAQANLERAQALEQGVQASTGVQTALTGSATVGQTSNLGLGHAAGAHTTFDGGLGVSYELDAVGRIKRLLEASAASTEAQAAATDLVKITVVANTVGAYSDACSFGARLNVAKRLIRLQENNLALLQRGVQGGIYSDLDLTRSQALLAQLKSAVPVLESGQTAALYQLAVLMGKQPEQYPPEAAQCNTPLDVKAALPVGDGTALIARRPDIRQAERLLAASTANIGVATADLYPRVTLGASVGSTARQFSQLSENSAVRFSVGPLMSWQFPNTAVVRANIAASNAQAKGALAQFDATVLNALRETDTALNSYAKDLDEHQQLQIALDESRKATEQENRLFKGGLASGLELLDVQRSLATAENALAVSEGKLSSDRIRLFLALGGGWEPTQHP